MQLSRSLFVFFAIFQVHFNYNKCLTIRVDQPKDVYKEKQIDKNKAKKSVETLYSIENDFNRVKHHHDGYEYYVPEKYVKPHPENLGLENVGEVNSFQQLQHEHHHKYQQQILTINPAQLLAQQEHVLRAGLATNPLLAALVLSQSLGIPSAGAASGFNHPAHLPINPYVALLLSHYGRYIQPAAILGRHQRGIYGYAAANNYHNNKPFGSYKIYEDAK